MKATANTDPDSSRHLKEDRDQVAIYAVLAGLAGIGQGGEKRNRGI